MFTSRSEFRVSLRADNADLRLTAKGRLAGVVDDRRWDRFERVRSELDRGAELLKAFALAPRKWAGVGITTRESGTRRT